MIQESREFTDIALNAQLDTFFLFEPATKKALRWNRAFREISGYSDREIAELPAPDSYYTPKDLNRAEAFISKVLHEGTGTIELELLRKDGKMVPTEYRVSIISDEEQEAKYIISIGRDISGRRKAEIELHSREILFRTAIESFPADLFCLDRNQCYTLQNSVSKGLWGDITGKCPDDVAPNKEILSLWKENNQRVLSGETVKGEITAVVHGEERYYYNIIAPIIDRDSITGILGINIDITDRKQAEEAYRVLVDTSLQAAIILQKDRIVFANPAAERISGYSIEELQDMENPVRRLIHPEDLPVILERVQRRARGEKDSPFIQYRIVPKNGKPRWVESQTAPISYKGEPAEHTVYIDVNERKEMEEQLHQSEKMQAVGQLAGGIAHDFNNQLGAILVIADMLRKSHMANNETIESCNKIITSVERASDLTSKLLAFSRKGNYVLLPIDIHRLIIEVTDMLRRTVDKRVEIKQHLDARVSIILGDASQLQNTLLNLGLNARDAMPDGGELLFSTENVVLREPKREGLSRELHPGEYIRVSVSDTGIGISEENITSIFEPFFTTKDLGKGTGMGLAAVHGTVITHGGAIKVESLPGRGTTFIIYFSTKEDLITSGHVPEDRTVIGGKGNILLVDDEDLICQVIREVLMNLGYNVEICRDGKQAVEYFCSSPEKFDLVILDMVMPKLSGKEALEQMKRSRSDVKVQVSSGYSTETELQGIFDAGASGFIQKPFDIASLAKKVAEILGSA